MPNLEYFIDIHPNNSPTHFILEILEDLGYYSLGMDKIPLSFAEIKAYLDMTKQEIDPFFIPLLRKLSIIYINYSNTDKDEPHPTTKQVMGGMTKAKLNAIRNM